MKGKYDLIMMIAVDFGHTPFLDIPVVFCSAVCSSHSFFVARTCSILWLEMIEIWTERPKYQLGLS